MSGDGWEWPESTTIDGYEYDHCDCPGWWACPVRGCYEDAKKRYADVMVDRDRTFEPRPEHDMATDGRKLKGGR
jgi:hypothetical protein